jgi:hypothetical protein
VRKNERKKEREREKVNFFVSNRCEKRKISAKKTGKSANSDLQDDLAKTGPPLSDIAKSSCSVGMY